MVAAACLTLAAVHALVWWRRHAARANLLFAMTAVATTLLAAGEFWMMRAETPLQFATALCWTHTATFVLIVALVWFVRLYLRAGRPWLAWLIFALRTLALVLNFSTGQNLYYRQVTALRRIPFLGEPISVGVGVPNPWMLVAQLSLVLLILFVADATVTVWRRGDRRQAVIGGGGILFSALLGTVQSVLVFWNILAEPILTSVFYMGIVIAMGLELSRNVIRAAELLAKLTLTKMLTNNTAAKVTAAGGTGGADLHFRDDGIGHTVATATALPTVGGAINFNLATGVIVPTSEASPNPTGAANYTSDLFKFTLASTANISVTANDGSEYITPGVADGIGSLRSTLSILNAAGMVIDIATEDASTLFETFSGSLAAGTYELEVNSFGGHLQVNSNYNGAQNYFDMGEYFLTGSGFDVNAVPEPGTWALIALGAGLLVVTVRRRAVSK